MKKISFILFFLVSFSGYSQNYLGVSSSNYAGAMGMDIQPASFVDGRFKFDLNLFSTNFSEIFKAQTNAKDSLEIEEANFNLGSVLLKNTELLYNNDFSGSKHHWQINRMEGSLSLNQDLYDLFVSLIFKIMEKFDITYL